MSSGDLSKKIHSLSDLELAVLSCLVADQHCIIQTEPDAVQSSTDELRLISSNTFGLHSVVLDCSNCVTPEDLARGVLVSQEAQEFFYTPVATPRPQDASTFATSRPNASPRPETRSVNLHEPIAAVKVANVVIAQDLDLASRHIQVEVLELLRTKRACVGIDTYIAPARFLFIALLTGDRSGPRLKSHLNDHILLSHHHAKEDGFPNLEDVDAEPESDDASDASVVRKIPRLERSADGEEIGPIFSPEDIDHLIAQRKVVTINIDVKRYMQDIIVHLRMHRAMALGGGVTTQATRYMDLLVRCLASLHSMTYVTPSLVALAVRKVYPHRIKLCAPEDERSLQWGSDLKLITSLLKGLSPEDVVEEILGSVEVPL